jgi:hypothetical protein
MNEVDLESVLSELGAELPVNVRKTLKAAVENGWRLNKPGITIALRLDHPTLEDAYPVYIAWELGRTPTGKISWRFQSCGTKSLNSLSGAELLEYMADPSLTMPAASAMLCGSHLCDAREVFVWVGGVTYCEKHAKRLLPLKVWEAGPTGKPSEYDPSDPPPWDDSKEPVESLQAALGATVVLDMGVTPSPVPVTPGPALRVSAPSLPSS